MWLTNSDSPKEEKVDLQKDTGRPRPARIGWQEFRPHILLIEDSPMQAAKIKMTLENAGCYVDWAHTGEAGLSMAEDKRYDVIVLDIELPAMTGFQVCQVIKANPRLINIPVIMLTTRDQAEDGLNGLDIGAVDYIPKDVFAEIVLLETIKQMRHQGQIGP